MKPSAALAVCALLAVGCSSAPEATPDDVQREAEAQFQRAVFLLNQGDLVGSWRAMQEMNGLVERFLEPDLMGSRPRAGEVLASGRPLAEWQREWNERYRLSAQVAWPTIRQAIEDESIDLSLLKGYVSEFLGQSYLARVGEEYRRLEPVFRSRRARQYWYSCPEMGSLCEVARDALMSRLPPGTMTTVWTGDRGDYRGLIEVEIQVLRQISYVRGEQERGRLPESASVTFHVSTRAGSSPWDGDHTFEIRGELPSRIAPHELARISQDHWDNLRRDLSSRMSAFP